MSQSDKTQLMEKYWLSFLMWCKENDKTSADDLDEEHFWSWYVKSCMVAEE